MELTQGKTLFTFARGCIHLDGLWQTIGHHWVIRPYIDGLCTGYYGVYQRVGVVAEGPGNGGQSGREGGMIFAIGILGQIGSSH